MNEGTHARDRDPDEIERDIRRTRVSLGHTIDELENRLSPGELLDQAIGAARRHGGDFATNLGRSAENHPMPLLLTAVGIAWMMASANRPPPPARPRSERADADLSGRADEAKHRLRHGLDSAKSTASAVGDRASRARYAVGDTVSHTGERMRLQSRRMKDGFSHMLEEQPLLVGAMGIALGAALGAALPRSEAEDRLMGESSDAAARQVKDRAADAYDEVKHTADEMAASVQQHGEDSPQTLQDGRTH